MLIIAPSRATFDGVPINDVESIAVEHSTDRLVVERADSAPDPAFVDVAQRRTTLKLTCLLRRASIHTPVEPTPGTLGALTFTTGPTQLATAPAAVVTSVSYQLAALPKGAVARRTIEFILTSPGGAPVLSMTTIGGGA